MPTVLIQAYDGSRAGPPDAASKILINNPRALVRLLRAPRGLGLSRAWVAGEIVIDGDLRLLSGHENVLRDPKVVATALFVAARTAQALGWRGFREAGPTGIEYRALKPGRHSVPRDLRELDFHYGISSDFYRIMLGERMAYSCGIFPAESSTLDEAQDEKHHRICDKLGLDERAKVLDIGCGWGSFLRYAAGNFGALGIGITGARDQYLAATERHSPVARSITFKHGDYRQILPLSGVTAATSIGMYEHVGESNSPTFFGLVRSCLPTGARYLNQAIVRREEGPRRFRANSFTQRYIFPNGQLMPLSRQLRDLDRAGFSVLSVETFGRHYARTLRHWLDNLHNSRTECIRIVGAPRFRAWEAYLVGSQSRFENGSIDVAQVLAKAR